jgi:hypothetical protein
MFSHQNRISIAITGTFDQRLIELITSLFGEAEIIEEARITMTDSSNRP